MTAETGTLLLIKVGDGASTEHFSTIGGLIMSSMTLGNQLLDASNVAGGVWRQLIGGAGVQKITLHGSGTFTDAASEELVRGYAFAASVNNYQLFFANGDVVSGAFLVAGYERSGDYGDAEQYALTLESAGAITFTAG